MIIKDNGDMILKFSDKTFKFKIVDVEDAPNSLTFLIEKRG